MQLSPEQIATAQQAFSLYQKGQYQQALALAEKGLASSAGHPGLLNLAAVCALPLGLLEQAEGYLQSAIATQPDYATAHGTLGLVLSRGGRPDEAEAAFMRALALNPGDCDSLTNLGNLYRSTRRPAQAEAAFNQALHQLPEHVNARYNLGLLLTDLDRLDEAEAAYRLCLKVQPDQADVLNDLGNVLTDRLRLGEAELTYRKAIALRPDSADAYYNLGMLLVMCEHPNEAMNAFKRALALSPGHPDALNSTASLLCKNGQFDEAEQTYRMMLAANPNSADTHNNLGNLLKETHRFAEAEVAYRTAVSLEPNHGHALGQALACARSQYDWSRAEADAQMVMRALEEDIAGIPELMVLSMPNTRPEHHLKAAMLTAKHALKPYLAVPPLVDPSLHRSHERLRIGYLSAEFHSHPVMHLLAGVFEMHDRTQFEIHAYSTGSYAQDAYRKRVEKDCEYFHDLCSISKVDAARQIAADEIDILVDLSGHASDSRPAITALRPAPVIVNFLGNPGTLGLPRLADYIIGDAVLTPLEHAGHYSETLAWMPHCYQPNDPKLMIGDKPTRLEAGLPEEGLVFCSFNQTYKLTPAMFDLWCKLLDEVPDSVLWLQHPGGDSAIGNLQREATARGIAPARLIFGPKLTLSGHLARLQLADLALDTFPYGSGATGSNVLRAGVPMVTLRGESYVSRMAASQLHAVGLPELVTSGAEDYFNLAKTLALDPEKRAVVRGKLANRFTTPLFDTPGFTLDLERLYQRIWQDHGRGVRTHITN